VLFVVVCGGGGGPPPPPGASYPLSSQAPTPVEVELGCDNIMIPMITNKGGPPLNPAL
jgi:hypothetical protein